MMRARLAAARLAGHAARGSMLNLPVATASLDHVVSIGCFHHTGNLQRCTDETHRVMKTGGRAVIMVYNQFSYRQWARWPVRTMRAAIQERSSSESRMDGNEAQRHAYDADPAGRSAPETVFTSPRALRSAFHAFSRVDLHKENCTDIGVGFSGGIGWPPQRARREAARQGDIEIAEEATGFRLRVAFNLGMSRRSLLRVLGRRLGLDIYAIAIK